MDSNAQDPRDRNVNTHHAPLARGLNTRFLPALALMLAGPYCSITDSVIRQHTHEHVHIHSHAHVHGGVEHTHPHEHAHTHLHVHGTETGEQHTHVHTALEGHEHTHPNAEQTDEK